MLEEKREVMILLFLFYAAICGSSTAYKHPIGEIRL